MVEKEPHLKDRSIKYSAIGAQKLTVPSNGGEMFPVSNDVDGLQGLDPSLAVCDEIGFMPQESWDSLLLASGKRPNSLVVGIGTPGLDRENALFHLRKLQKEGESLPGFIFTEYAADHNTKVDDLEQWRKANPALAEGYMNEAALHTALALSPEAHFRIFRLGQWVDGVESWLGADGRAVWDALIDKYEFVLKAPTWVGVDVGIKRDSTCVASVQFRPDGRLHVKTHIWVPTKEEPVDVTDVMEYLRNLTREYQVGAISFDPRFFDVPALYLHDEGLPMVEIPQSVERMTPIIGNIYERILKADISHDGDELTTTQVLNAVPRFNERGFTLQKSKSRGRIDAAIAMALAIDRALYKKAPRPPIVVL
jgi:phage terminase large subunit-like protein